MGTELISVIVPIYKIEPYLDKCIQSIVQQTYSNLEIILVDDGSPDGCPVMCDRWAEKDDRIRVVHKANGGISSARNAGLRIAQGQIITFVDPDDYIDPKMLEMMMAEMDDETVGVVQCGFQEVYPRRVLDYTSGRKLRMDAYLAIEQELQGIDDISAMVWGKLFRRRTIENVEFCEDFRFAEDTPFIIQALIHAENVVVLPFIGYYYTRREDSLVGFTYQPYKIQHLQAMQILAEAVTKAYPQLADLAQYKIAYGAFWLVKDLSLIPHCQKKYPEDWAICVQTLRKGDPAAFKKYLSTKDYILFQLCRKAPAVFAVIYYTWKKIKGKLFKKGMAL